MTKIRAEIVYLYLTVLEAFQKILKLVYSYLQVSDFREPPLPPQAGKTHISAEGRRCLHCILFCKIKIRLRS